MASRLALIALIAAFACGKDDPTPSLGTPDWSPATHEKRNDPDYQIVFPQQSVNRIDITIEAGDWTNMQNDLISKYGPGNNQPGGGPSIVEPIFVPCTFRFNDKDWYKVGIRYKGNSSLRTALGAGVKKLPFKIDFDEFEDTYPEIKNQRFYGFKQLSLSNGFQDKSLIREKVVADIFRNAGVRSPQTAFYRVYLDYGEGVKYFGLYTAVEVVDDTMIEDQFPTKGGNIYKPEGQGASFAFNSFDQNHFEKCNNKETDWSDIQGVFTALHSTNRTTNPAIWRNDLESHFYVHGFLKWLAANTIIQNWDTYGKMTHNYYLYADPENGNRLAWIPWDNNEALAEGKMGGALSISLAEVTSSWPLIRYLMDQPEYKLQYDNYIDEFINGPFKPEIVQVEYLRLYNLIKPYAVGSDGEAKPYSFLNSSTEFESAHVDLKSHVTQRYNAANDYLH